MKVIVVVGTRPELIKMYPVIRELENHSLNYFILHTGQHYSYNLDEIFFRELKIPRPKYCLNVGSGSHAEETGKILVGVEKILKRENPDVMLVGEIRDPQTAELAVRASITGHLVLSTLHTNDAIGTIPRLIDLNIPPYLIGSGLLGVIAQRLVRKLCSYCKKELEMTEEKLLEIGVPQNILNKYSNYKVYKATGCEHCKNTGYSGREAVVEILDVDKEIESLITEGASALDLLKIAKQKGMHSMKEDGYIKVLNGITSFEEVNRVID